MREANTQVIATERVFVFVIVFLLSKQWLLGFFSPLLFIVSISFSSPHFNEQDLVTDRPHLEN